MLDATFEPEASSFSNQLLQFERVRALLLEDLEKQKKELLQSAADLVGGAKQNGHHASPNHAPSNYSIITDTYQFLKKLSEQALKGANQPPPGTQSSREQCLNQFIARLSKITLEAPSESPIFINSEEMIRMTSLTLNQMIQFVLQMAASPREVGEIAWKVYTLLKNPESQRPELVQLVNRPSKKILFAYLTLLRTNLNPSKVPGCLEELVASIASTDLTSLGLLRKVHQTLLGELTKICLISLAKESEPNPQLVLILLEYHMVSTQFVYCFCLKSSAFQEQYFKFVLGVLAGCASFNYELELIKRLVRVWEVAKPRQAVSEFLQVLFNVASNSEQYKTQAVSIVNMLLHSNIDQLVVENLHIIPYFEMIDESMRSNLFEKCFPLAVKAVEKKENNVALNNLLLEWWIKMYCKPESTIHFKEHEKFFRYFKEIIPSLTESSVQSIYNISDPKLRKVLMCCMARNLKLRKNFKEETMNKFILIETMKKLPPDSEQFENGLKSALQLIVRMHENFHEDFTFATYEFPEASVRTVLRTIYNNNLSPLYYNSMNRIEKLYGKDALELLRAVFQAEAVLEDASSSQRVKMLQEDVFILINRNADLLEDVLSELNRLFRGLSNCTTTSLYLSAILYGSVSFLDVDNLDTTDAELLELHISEFLQQLSSNISVVYFTYSAQSFRLCLTLSLLRCNSVHATELLQHILAIWMKFTTLKEISMYYDSCKYDVGSEFLQEEYKTLQILQAKASKSKGANQLNAKKILKPTEQRLLSFLEVFRQVVRDEDSFGQRRNEMFLKPGYSNRCTVVYDIPMFKELRNLCNFEIKIDVFKRFVQVPRSSNLQRLNSIRLSLSEHQQLAMSRMETSRLDEPAGKTELLSNHRLTIRLSNYTYIVHISSSQVYTIIRKTNAEEKVIESFTDKNPHFRTELALRFDMLSKRIHLDINRAAVCQLACQLNEDTEEIVVEYEFNEEAALSAVKVKESEHRYSFPLKSTLEVRDQFTVKLEHLKSSIAVMGAAEYFQLKYLYALLLHIINNKYSYSVTHVSKAVGIIYQISLLKLVQTPEVEDREINFEKLKELTKTLLNRAKNFQINGLEEPLLKVVNQQGAGCTIAYKFIEKVLLDFELWHEATFAIQLTIVELASKVVASGSHFSLRGEQHLAFFLQVVSIAFDSYKLDQSYGGVKPADKAKLKKTAVEMLVNLMDYSDFGVLKQQFSQCMGRICRSEDIEKPDSYLKDAVQRMVNMMLCPYYGRENNKYKVVQKEPILDMLRMKELRLAIKYLTPETKLVILELVAVLLNELSDEHVSKVVRSALLNLAPSELQLASNTMIDILAGERQRIEHGAYRRSLTIVQLLASFAIQFCKQAEDKQELIITIMMIYFQSSGSATLQSSKEILSLSSLFGRVGFVSMLVCMVQMETKAGVRKMPKRKKLVEQIFRAVFLLPKKDYFLFAQSYRQLADTDLQAQQYLLSEAIANSPTTALPLHNVTLQFCFYCLVSLQQTFDEERFAFAQLIYTYVKTLVESERSMAYSAYPGFGYPTIYSKMVFASDSDGVQIRGGIFFKILLILFKCIELLENPSIFMFLVELFTSNLQRLQHFKQVRKLKVQRQLAVSDLFAANKDYSENNEIQELIRAMSNRYVEKYSNDKPVGEVCFSEDFTRGQVAFFCLEYTMLRLIIMSQEELAKPDLKKEASTGFRKLLETYPRIRMEVECSQNDILNYGDFKQFLQTKESGRNRAFTNTSSDSPFKINNTPEPSLNLGFSQHAQQLSVFQPKANTPIKRMSSIQASQPTKTIEPKLSYRGETSTMAASKAPSATKAPSRRKSIHVNLEKVTQEEARLKFKQCARREAKRLLTLEFMYTFIAEKNQGKIVFVKEFDNEQQLPPSIITSKVCLFLNGQLLSAGDNSQQTDKISQQWNAFMERCEREDGLLWEKVHAKDPILQIRPTFIMNGTYPITQLTSDYNYTIQKQETLSLTRRSNYLSHSFLKSQAAMTVPAASDIDSKKDDLHDIPLLRMGSSQATNEMSARDRMMSSFLSDEEPSSPYNKDAYDCEMITVRGSYFCSLKIDRVKWKITIQSDGKSRPDAPEQLRFGSPKENILLKKISITINIVDIAEVITRKFNQIANNSIEIFTRKNTSYFIVLYTSNYAREFLKILKGSRLLNVECLVDNCESTFKKRRYTEKWATGQITNFDYLMLLNKYSGRSFNDPNQYYIFPWVLSDYESKELNLRNHEVYRRLDRPIGAINELKLARYEENEACQQTDKYLYGSFFSTSLFVFFYLVRLEPYSTMARELQNGHFDAADRLFLSVSNTWNSVINESNTSDVKQLIPEFFYLPAFLLNHNSLNLGKTQDGVQVGNVGLPPWASCPNDFITKMRAALESDFVSSMLHAWVDMIFGVAQNSRKRLNVFHPRYYMENIKYNELQEEEIDPMISQITYFGQFPIRLFSKDHPRRAEANLKYFIGLEMDPRKLSMRREQLTPGQSIESISLSYKKIVVCINEARSIKYYSIDTTIEPFKKVEIEGKNPHALFTPSMVLENDRAQFLYLNSDPQTKILLKRFNIDKEYNKAVVSDRFIALCGRKGVHVYDLEGQEYISWTHKPVVSAVFLSFGVVFVTRPLQLHRLNFLTKACEEIPLTEEYEDRIYHLQIQAVEDRLKEVYILAINRRELVYLTRHHNIN